MFPCNHRSSRLHSHISPSSTFHQVPSQLSLAMRYACGSRWPGFPCRDNQQFRPFLPYGHDGRQLLGWQRQIRTVGEEGKVYFGHRLLRGCRVAWPPARKAGSLESGMESASIVLQLYSPITVATKEINLSAQGRSSRGGRSGESIAHDTCGLILRPGDPSRTEDGPYTQFSYSCWCMAPHVSKCSPNND